MENAAAETLLAGRYALGPSLGHGGMGSVHEAIDRRLERPVAVKLLRADLAAQPRARRRFETEARAAARLTHPNVVTVFDSGEHDGVPYLVMERLPGRTLGDELAAGPLPVERARELTEEILAALAAAHGAGVLHRDIKPGNVLLTEDGHAKVSDFGIAKTVDDADQTQTAELVATVAYLAPERLAGEPASARSDLYSVGVVLYEALSGRRAFEGDTPVAVMLAVERGLTQSLAKLKPATPAALVAVVERAMSRDADQRFESADAMAAALRTFPDPEATVPVDTSVAADTVPADLVVGRDETRPLPAPGSVDAPRRAPTRLRVLGVVFGAVLAAGLVAGVAESRGGTRSPGSFAPPTTAPAPRGPTPTTTAVPGPLGDALHRLEQAVAK